MVTARFVKLDAQGNALPANSSAHVQVLDNLLGLIWTVGALNQDTEDGTPWAECDELVKACRIGAAEDWRWPTVEELFSIADRSRKGPAIDLDIFPGTKSDWYWSGTPLAGAEVSCAWGVFFNGGYAYGNHRGYDGFVRAVRSVRAPSQ